MTLQSYLQVNKSGYDPFNFRWYAIFADKFAAKIMRYTQTTLKKIEGVFEELDYAVRYEKGSFQSGYCLVENRRIAVINKFFDVEARINTLLDILSRLEYDPALLSENSQEMIVKWKKNLDE